MAGYREPSASREGRPQLDRADLLTRKARVSGANIYCASLLEMKNMKKTLLALITAAMFAAGGCKVFRQMPQSKFLSVFSLDKSVRRTGYKGINYSGPGGGIGGSSGMVGQRDTDVHHSSATGFMINEAGDARFDEREFMEALTAQIKKEIEASGGAVTASGSRESNEFYFEYKSGSIEGRITISGSRRGSYYSLKADADESSK